jgi:hypothetical protein
LVGLSSLPPSGSGCQVVPSQITGLPSKTKEKIAELRTRRLKDKERLARLKKLEREAMGGTPRKSVFKFLGEKAVEESRKTLDKIGITKNQQDVLSRMYYADKENIYIKYDQDIHWVNFMNHSKNPNMTYGLNKYFAKRNIKANEELTLDFKAKQYHPELNFKENE